MNKYQKALGSLWSVFKYEPIEKIDEERKENLKHLYILKELVEKATPKKYVERVEFVDEIKWMHASCPNCKEIIDEFGYYPNCPNCGQALDWSEEE